MIEAFPESTKMHLRTNNAKRNGRKISCALKMSTKCNTAIQNSFKALKANGLELADNTKTHERSCVSVQNFLDNSILVSSEPDGSCTPASAPRNIVWGYFHISSSTCQSNFIMYHRSQLPESAKPTLHFSFTFLRQHLSNWCCTSLTPVVSLTSTVTGSDSEETLLQLEIILQLASQIQFLPISHSISTTPPWSQMAWDEVLIS